MPMADAVALASASLSASSVQRTIKTTCLASREPHVRRLSPHGSAPASLLTGRLVGPPANNWTLAHPSASVKRQPNGASGPGRGLGRRAAYALLQRRVLPRIGARRGPRGPRRRLPHEPLERGDDRGCRLGP